ncbi:hypothetical protein RB628_16040 [Streptomyces sp. ADMS]|uniref:hypothetical protein n=1 Tax=Streptomyces sp. ADMS TaxID=3071415 RepID=UPI00296FAF38|nr:hypothetical protein [Streptomyces sp. ADMS]MDW4906810.1 hypothetical protein [Streptomyces sp. ADMS]
MRPTEARGRVIERLRVVSRVVVQGIKRCVFRYEALTNSDGPTVREAPCWGESNAQSGRVTAPGLRIPTP